MVGEKKTEKSIGFFKTVGEVNGERVETSGLLNILYNLIE
jgi:hypothetical protein